MIAAFNEGAQMFEKSASSNRQEMNGCSFQQVLREIGS